MLLSIIVPVYNTEKYLQKCIESILDQTYEEKEIILVDDGSTDGSGALCDAYAQKYENIITLHTENNGLLLARYNGILAASGEYITFVDADDWISVGMYDVMMKQITSCDMIACQIKRYFDDENVVSDQLSYIPTIYDKEEIEKEIIPRMFWDARTNNWALDPSLCSKIFKKDKILKQFSKVRDLECYYGEDTIIIYPFILQADSIRLLSDCFYYHRQRTKGEIPAYIRDEQFVDKTYKVYRYLKSVFIQTKYWEILQPQLEHFYINAVLMKKRCFGEKEGELYPMFPFSNVFKNARVIIYGAGKVGKAYIKQNEEQKFCEVVLWVDRNYESIEIPNYNVVSPDRIATEVFDYIIIAIDIRSAAYEVKLDLLQKNVKEEQIIWHSIRRDCF